MSVDYLERQPFDDPNVGVILRECREAILRADSVVRGLLDFSAPSRLLVEAADLNAIIRQALLLVRGELSQGHFNIVEELAADLPPVAVDALKMEQVFVNIITNAIHAMKGGGTLTLRTSTRQLTGTGENISRTDLFRVGDQLLEAEVLDSGPGIASEALNKIFEPFFTTKPTGKGTGLGLTVTKTIIDLHGGTISIRNRPEGGASVLVVLKATYPPL
jgi:signal transduction histidine kinase